MPVVTLSTDIGQGDYVVGAIKGQLISALPSVTIIDITHQLVSNNYLHASYVCANAFAFYPPGTFHFVIINLFERAPGHLLLIKHNDQFIVCPDNGILTMITGEKPESIIAIPIIKKNLSGVLSCAATFARALLEIQNGVHYEKTGDKISEIEEKYPFRSTVGHDWIDSQIIFIDKFDNVVINLTKAEFEEHRKGRNFRIVLPSRNDGGIVRISENYASVDHGEMLAWFNSAGYLELAINKGNLAGLFGLKHFSGGTSLNTLPSNSLMYERVKIFFD